MASTTRMAKRLTTVCQLLISVESFDSLEFFSGSNSDQSMWNQSEVLRPRARYLCPPGINWLADAGLKIWPFLMVPFDERRGK
ncbi:hypothetical protein L916_17881, partial [Phytophthora nicotianae]